MTVDVAEALIELQSIDVEILRAEKRLDDLPEKRAILATRTKMKETAAIREKAVLLERKLSSELKARQDEISSLTEKIAAEQAKVMATTDHRQIQALTREMDGLKRRVDKLEVESIQFMERVDKARAQIATVDSALEKLSQSEQELIARYREVGGAIQTEISELRARRAVQAARVGEDLVSRYEKIRDAKGGIGAGRLDGGSCTACHMTLPAERVRELEAGPDIGVCPQCRRLIVVRTESA